MRLVDYWKLFGRWWGFVVAGMIIGALTGNYLAHRGSAHTADSYHGTATVLVNYITPANAPYNPQLSAHDTARTLTNSALDPVLLRTVYARSGVARHDITSISTSVALDAPLITVDVVGSTAGKTETMAISLAEALAAIHERTVQAEERLLQSQARLKLKAARHKWLVAQSKYYQLCGCIGLSTRPLVGRKVLATLNATTIILQHDYDIAKNSYESTLINVLPAATAMPGSAVAESTANSGFKTVLAGTLLGLLLAIGLAALVDYIRDLPFFLRTRRARADGAVAMNIQVKLGREGIRHSRAIEVAEARPSGSDARLDEEPKPPTRLFGNHQ